MRRHKGASDAVPVMGAHKAEKKLFFLKNLLTSVANTFIIANVVRIDENLSRKTGRPR